MSLSKIGNLTKAFKTYKSNPLDATGLTTALSSFGDLNTAAKYLRQVNSDGYLTENIAGSFLHNAYRAHSIIDATASYSNTTASSGGLKTLLSLNGIKSVGSGLSTVLGSIAPTLIGMLFTGLAVRLGKISWDNFFTNNAAKSRYKESSEKYSTAKSELENLQSQKASNKERLYELNAKGNLSTSEQQERNNLIRENQALDSQTELKKNLVSSTQKQLALDAKKALEKRSFQGNLFGTNALGHWIDCHIFSYKPEIKPYYKIFGKIIWQMK